MRALSCTWLLALQCAACAEPSGAPRTEAQAGAANSPAGGSGAASVGVFSLQLIVPSESNPSAYAALSGKVYDGPLPASVSWQMLDHDADCTLEKPVISYCEPACAGDAVCVAADECQPYPQTQDVGTVDVRGLGDAAFAMTPIAHSYQPPAGLHLPNPPCSVGATFELQARGGALPAFALTGRCIAPLVLAGSDQDDLPIRRGAPLELLWEPATQPGTRVTIRLDVSHHGGLKGQLTCDVADSGSATISRSLIAALLQLGVAGYPVLTVRRTARSSVNLNASVIALEVSSERARSVTIPGLVSCATSADCPAGQTCRVDRSCG